MKCEICQQNEAETVFFREKEDGTEEELYVCKSCAMRERAFGKPHGIQVATMETSGLPQPPVGPEENPMDGAFDGAPKPVPPAILNQLKKLIGGEIELPGFPGESDEPTTKCPTCGTSLTTIQQDGRLGCAACYTTFEKEIADLLSEIQDCTQYPGPPPKWMEDEIRLKELNTNYRDALIREDYDAAEQIAQAIKALKAKRKAADDSQEEM